jgi:hypothetical protein
MKHLISVILLVIVVVFVSSFATKNNVLSNSNAKITRIYPNPATSYIIFEFDKSIDRNYSLQIFTFFGKKMAEIRLSDSKLNIPLDDSYTRGLYIYQLQDLSGKLVESGKFQVNK